MILYFNAFKICFNVSNAWIVQPQTVEKKLHAPLISPNFTVYKRTVGKSEATIDQTWGELIVNANALIMHYFFQVIQGND